MTGVNAHEERASGIALNTCLAPLAGLILAGGASRRMGKDKANLVYEKISPFAQAEKLISLLKPFCAEIFISRRFGQEPCRNAAGFRLAATSLFDGDNEGGPGAGLLAGAARLPQHGFLVVACDMPFIDEAALQCLDQGRSRDVDAVYFQHHDEVCEPLFAIWEPRALNKLRENFKAGEQSPRRTLENPQLRCRILQPQNERLLLNINSVQQAREAGL